MAFKPIDLQWSIPRTPEAGGIQSQSNHKANAEVSRLAELASKQTEQLRSRNTGVEQTGGTNVRNDRERQNGNPYLAKRKQKQGQEESANSEEKAEHPYKGHHVDITL
ncbi:MULTISPECIES: hypothetical protein [unclassified Paenibacillus]|uniref:hypothetical protein n=1 Tax=unclassified Paenibacillus TaxID=185978 RepID=UPI001046368F|nr:MULTISPECIES: hypothetical protein [unclassified Paenibacillus]NIK68856.1 hypothetical protein [Paenibacillus sp. BK720]TCM98871.1 hypothetical protein EV294_102156 [Paenibacillus sp. BK033]